jgi:pimeloyl-ACP methyl ester carboxylesterase
MFKIILFGLLAVIGLIITTGIGGLALRAYCQNQNAKALKIYTPNGINEEMFIRIGGIDQWIQIRGENRENPVILILHGGPGFSYIPFTPIFRSWEKHFTVVQWDQRGSGKTFGKNGKEGSGSITIDQMTQDGIEVAEFVRKHLKKDKIILFAHSWGTVLGIPMVAKRSDLFSAYVGTGQVVDMARNETVSYDLVLKHLRETGDEKAIKTLEELGVPPYKDFKTWMVKGRMIVMNTPPSASGRTLPNVFGLALSSPSYSLKDGYDLFSAFNFSSERLYEEMMLYKADRFGMKFKIPVFIIQGDADIQSPTSIVKEYFSSIEAPKKELVLLKGEGHTAILILPDIFLNELLEKVRPFPLRHWKK